MDTRVLKLGKGIVEHVDEVLSRLDGLSVEQANWRPVEGETNSCWVLAVHVVGASEDIVMQRLAGEHVDRDRDSEFSAVASDAAEFDRLTERWQVLRPRLLDAIEQLPSERLDAIVEHPRRGKMTGYEMLLFCLVHAVSHASEASLTRMLATATTP